MMTAGNLSMTQGVITRIDEDIERAAAGEDIETVLNASSMFRVAQIVGEHLRGMQDCHRE